MKERKREKKRGKRSVNKDLNPEFPLSRLVAKPLDYGLVGFFKIFIVLLPWKTVINDQYLCCSAVVFFGHKKKLLFLFFPTPPPPPMCL